MEKLQEKRPLKLLFPICFLGFFVIVLFFTLFSGNEVVDNSAQDKYLYHHHGRVSAMKLFVFGDSYVDTGNSDIRNSIAWIVPYGITFPGKPAGRYSDGRVFPDYIATYFGIKSPVPYQWRQIESKLLRYGMNFAYGGTGVFDTLLPGPNMTTQIDFLESAIRSGMYTKHDLLSSVALVSVDGNDYTTYVAKYSATQSLQSFISAVVDQMVQNLKRIHGLGIRRIAVSSLAPLGCLPSNTAVYLHQQCNETINSDMSLHNILLQKAVKELNKNHVGGDRDSRFVILDFYNSFMTAFKSQGDIPGSMKFENPLKPCCAGISDGYDCGSVDKNTGAKKYVLCENPEKAFFWDKFHPTQEAWHSIYLALRPSLRHLLDGPIIRLPRQKQTQVLGINI